MNILSPKAALITYTPDPVNVCALAARTCYSALPLDELLDSRIEEAGATEAKTPVTKALLTNFINDAIWDCRLRLGAAENSDPSYIDEDAVMTIAEGKAAAQAQLEVLTAFLEDVEQNATEDNTPAFWVQYWTEVLELPIPQGYAY